MTLDGVVRFPELSIYLNPALLVVTMGLGLLAFMAVSQRVNPFTIRSRERPVRLNAGRVVGAVVALSGLAPRPAPAESLPVALLHSLTAAALVLAVLGLVALVAWAARRVANGPSKRAPAAGEWPDEPAPAMSAAERAEALDPVDAETRAAMHRLSDVVGSHDLGSAGPAPDADSAVVSEQRTVRDAYAGTDRAWGRSTRSGEPDAGTFDDAMTGGAMTEAPERRMTPTELDAAPRTELRRQVDHLSVRNDKLSAQNSQLHKVVIGQQASLDSERESHAHTKDVARRAKQAARVAIEHKKIATKVARRERSERLRYQDAHERSRDALANAMALLRARPDIEADARADAPGPGGAEPTGRDPAGRNRSR